MSKRKAKEGSLQGEDLTCCLFHAISLGCTGGCSPDVPISYRVVVFPFLCERTRGRRGRRRLRHPKMWACGNLGATTKVWKAASAGEGEEAGDGCDVGEWEEASEGGTRAKVRRTARAAWAKGRRGSGGDAGEGGGRGNQCGRLGGGSGGGSDGGGRKRARGRCDRGRGGGRGW